MFPMYETALAEQSYASPTRSTASLRGIEYQAFARITRDLSAFRDGAAGQFAKLAEALNDNLRLWTILGTDVAREGNALPPELRSKLFYLFEFTHQHTRKVLKGEAQADILVEINTAVMRGLRGSRGGEGAS